MRRLLIGPNDDNPTTEKAEDATGGKGVMIGIVVGTVALLVVVGVVIAFFIIKRRKAVAAAKNTETKGPDTPKTISSKNKAPEDRSVGAKGAVDAKGSGAGEPKTKRSELSSKSQSKVKTSATTTATAMDKGDAKGTDATGSDRSSPSGSRRKKKKLTTAKQVLKFKRLTLPEYEGNEQKEAPVKQSADQQYKKQQ